MAKINSENADATLRFSSFSGITSGKGFGKSGAEQMENFSILQDGSLEKRCGWFVKHSFSNKVRGFWEGSVSGTHYFFLVIGSAIYRYTESTDSVVTLSYLSTTVGNVYFTEYSGALFLFDGNSVYRFVPNSTTFIVSNGYVPLYGDNWHPTAMGKINEPLNLFQPKIRIRYLNTSASTVFRLPYPVQQIDRMYINDVAITNYSFIAGSSTFSIPSSLASGTLEVHCTLSSLLNQRALICNALYAQTLSNDGKQTLFCFGGTPGYRIYFTRLVSEEMLTESRKVYTTSDMVYFPADNYVTLGDSSFPIRATCQDGGRLLVANEQRLWAVEFDGDEATPLTHTIATGIGTLNFGQLFRLGKSLLTVSNSGIYLLSNFENDENNCKVERISDAVLERLGNFSFQRAIAFWRKEKDELWFRDPEDTAGKVFIYDLTKKEWMLYTNIVAQSFLQAGENFGFFSPTGSLCYFDTALGTDGGQAFSAIYKSHFLDLPKPDLSKRAVSALLGAYNTSAALSISLETERRTQTCAIPTGSASILKLHPIRFAPGRFRSLRWSISDNGTGRCRICFLSVSVKH